MVKILLVGSGGHAHSVLALLDRLSGYVPIGFIDSTKPVGNTVYGLPVLGNLKNMNKVCTELQVDNIAVTVGDNYSRAMLTKKIKRIFPASRFPVLVDPNAVIASDANLYPGVVIMALAHVGAGCILKDGVLVNSGASLDHDSTIAEHASLAPGVITGGGVRIGVCSALCIGSKIIHRVSIGSHTVIGAGSLVLSDVPSRVVAYGSPASIVRHRAPQSPYL